MENPIMKQGQSSTYFTHCNCGEYCTKFCVCVAYHKFCGESCPCKDCWNTPRNIVEVLRRRIETQNMIHQSLERKCAEFAAEIASSNEENKRTVSDALVSEGSSDDNNNTSSSTSLFESPTKRAKTSASSSGAGGCNCKENRCLGFWCTCFRTKELCSKKCTCRECCNNEKNKEKVMMARAVKDEKICSCKTGLCTTVLCYCHVCKQGCWEECECEGCSNIYGSKPK